MKHAFTPEGAATVLANLYQLPQETLDREAAAFGSDLKTWLAEHFELNSHQAAYVANLNAKACDFYAHMGSFALQHRLNIRLDVAPKSAGSPPAKDEEQGKIVYTRNSMTSVANDKGEMEAFGELSYCIRY